MILTACLAYSKSLKHKTHGSLSHPWFLDHIYQLLSHSSKSPWNSAHTAGVHLAVCGSRFGYRFANRSLPFKNAATISFIGTLFLSTAMPIASVSLVATVCLAVGRNLLMLVTPFLLKNGFVSPFFRSLWLNVNNR